MLKWIWKACLISCFPCNAGSPKPEKLFNQRSPRQAVNSLPSAIMPAVTACGNREQSRSRELPCPTPPASQDGALSAAQACGIHAAAKESNHWVSRGAEAEQGVRGVVYWICIFRNTENRSTEISGWWKQAWQTPGAWQRASLKRDGKLKVSDVQKTPKYFSSSLVEEFHRFRDCDETRDGANWSSRSGFYTRNRSVQILYE